MRLLLLNSRGGVMCTDGIEVPPTYRMSAMYVYLEIQME